MSNDFETHIATGRVTAEPDLKYSQKGVAYCTFTLAVNRQYGKGEDRKETTTFLRCTVWRDRAETVQQYVHKGSRLLVTGNEIKASPYIDKNGKAAAGLELTVIDFNFMDSKKDEDDSRPQGRSKPQQQSYDDSENIPF